MPTLSPINGLSICAVERFHVTELTPHYNCIQGNAHLYIRRGWEKTRQFLSVLAVGHKFEEIEELKVTMPSNQTRDKDLLVKYIPESEHSLPTAGTSAENKAMENTEDETIYEIIENGEKENKAMENIEDGAIYGIIEKEEKDSATTNRKRILQSRSSPDQNQTQQNGVSVIGLFEKELAKEREVKKRNTVEKTWRRLRTAVNQEQSSIELVFCFCRILILIFITAALAFLIKMKMPIDDEKYLRTKNE